jgi:hypothetical protein
MANSTNNPRRSDVPVIVISLATAFAWGGLFTLPKAAGLAIACGLLFMFGFWSVLFPSRLIEWAVPLQSQVNGNDQRWCWLARALGVVLMAVAAAAVLAR